MTTTLTVPDTTESLLKAWLDWGNTYAIFISENKAFIELMVRTQAFYKEYTRPTPLEKPEFEV